MAMSRNEIKEKLFDVMQMAMPNATFDADSLQDDADLSTDIGLSSVGILFVVIAIEEFFGVRFDNVGFSDFKTIGNVLDYIEEKQQS